MFFAALPSSEVSAERFHVRGVDVRIVSDQDRETVRGRERLPVATIRELVGDFGPFPMPRMEILLTGWTSGMEYFGATHTGLGSLRHELAHMYFGVTVVNRTWRDTWFDESAVVWWEEGGSLQPVRPGFRSSIGAGRPLAAPGFNEAAYGAGARVIEAIARAIGGREEMIRFLADLHARRSYRPFTTAELIADVLAAEHSVGRSRLERWLLGGG